jgi:hypothetical protein
MKAEKNSQAFEEVPATSLPIWGSTMPMRGSRPLSQIALERRIPSMQAHWAGRDRRGSFIVVTEWHGADAT